MRLRRLLRAESEYRQRLAAEGRVGPLAAVASARLLRLIEDVRATWAREAQGAELVGLRPYVQRTFVTMQAAAVAMARPGADVARLGAELREAGVPLVFCLRGLDDSEAPVVAELAGRALARSA